VRTDASCFEYRVHFGTKKILSVMALVQNAGFAQRTA
jgi:hypothetical protein